MTWFNVGNGTIPTRLPTVKTMHKTRHTSWQWYQLNENWKFPTLITFFHTLWDLLENKNKTLFCESKSRKKCRSFVTRSLKNNDNYTEFDSRVKSTARKKKTKFYNYFTSEQLFRARSARLRSRIVSSLTENWRARGLLWLSHTVRIFSRGRSIFRALRGNIVNYFTLHNIYT